MNCLYDWLLSNRLTLNVKKTQCLLFGPSLTTTDKNNFEVTVTEQRVEVVPSARFLGLIIDDQLNWENHIKSISKKVNFKCFVLKRLKNTLDSKTKRMLYFAILYPHLTYGVEHWGAATKKCINQLPKLQKYAVRIIGNAKSFSPNNKDSFPKVPYT